MSNANEILKKVKNGEADYHFIEIMCCPGGCVNGGGMPIQPSSVRNLWTFARSVPRCFMRRIRTCR